jgi:hypothetical protein
MQARTLVGILGFWHGRLLLTARSKHVWPSAGFCHACKVQRLDGLSSSPHQIQSGQDRSRMIDRLGQGRLARCLSQQFGSLYVSPVRIMKVRNGSKADMLQPTRCANKRQSAMQQKDRYSITSSARESRLSEILMPSALAVFKLTPLKIWWPAS